ncbi:M56 family metallopeptidase [Bacteroides sp. 51]|uniref:M56 family metallopeptidase n=1 Tax=Bacteroides sp. 51 TaxID=2302938 RepID=UPI0013D391DC|nr:M56 family metallopeptidase [Bacteroides sp. 51]NDV81197.1 M56 family peptidase [Bacteroides sp. 51]
MGVLFVYILKAAVCLAIFYLFYRLLLSRETFHRFNRIAVLSILVISLLIPFCEVKVTEQNEVHQTVLSLEQLLLLADMMEEVPVLETQSEKTLWVHVILYIYLVGILFFTCRNLYSLIRLGFLLKSGKREKLENGIILVIHDKNDLSPFSWMRYVVISRKDLEENGKEILIHELAHIRKRHSIDLLIADVCIFFQWFNPAAWLLKQELQNIHEYEADETVIKEGIDAKQYQLLLIKKAVGTRLYSMANSFNHSKLKKRITMMLKEKSSPWARLKYLYVLPLAAIAVSAFARPEISNELNEISKVKVNDLTAIVEANEVENRITQSVQPKNDTTEWYVESAEEVQQSRRNQEPDVIHSSLNVKIRSVNTEKEEGEKERLNALSYEDETNSIVLAMVVPKDKQEGEMTVSAETMSFSFSAAQDSAKVPSPNISFNKEPLFFINGKEVDYSIMSALDPNSIESIDVLKDETSTRIYGERGKNGVVNITLKSAKDKPNITIDPLSKGNFIEGTKSHIEGKPIVLLDGKEVDAIDSIDPLMIKSVNVLKDITGANEEEIKLFMQYGEKAKDGFILIKSKKPDDNTGIQLLGVQRTKGILVDGLVTDESGKPIVGAIVQVSGTTVGTVTNMDGKFQIMAANNATLTVSYIDMESSTVKVAPNVTVKLKAE